MTTFHVYFVAQALLSPENECRAGNVFEPGVFDPKFVHVFRLNFDRGGDVPELRTNQRESGFLFQNGGPALALQKNSQSV